MIRAGGVLELFVGGAVAVVAVGADGGDLEAGGVFAGGVVKVAGVWLGWC